MSVWVSSSMRFVVSPSISSSRSPAVEKGRRAVLLCFFTAGHLVSSGNRQAQRLCGGSRRWSIGKRGAPPFILSVTWTLHRDENQPRRTEIAEKNRKTKSPCPPCLRGE